MRQVADKDGKPIRQEHVAFMNAAQELSDTRIAAGATWSEVFSFDVPKGVQSRVEASLYYYYSPSAQTEAEEKIKFLNMSRLVP